MILLFANVIKRSNKLSQLVNSNINHLYIYVCIYLFAQAKMKKEESCLEIEELLLSYTMCLMEYRKNVVYWIRTFFSSLQFPLIFRNRKQINFLKVVVCFFWLIFFISNVFVLFKICYCHRIIPLKCYVFKKNNEIKYIVLL